jgi:hypothetical protein
MFHANAWPDCSWTLSELQDEICNDSKSHRREVTVHRVSFQQTWGDSSQHGPVGMDEAADVQLQRAVDNFTAAATPCELPDACPGTQLDDIVTHIGGEPSGIAGVLHSAQQALSGAMPAPMAEGRSVPFGQQAAAAQPAGSSQLLRRAQPMHPQLLPERLPVQMHLPSSTQQQQQPGLWPTRSAVAAFLSSLQPAEMYLLLGSMPTDRLLRMLALLPQGRLQTACIVYGRLVLCM